MSKQGVKNYSSRCIKGGGEKKKKKKKKLYSVKKLSQAEISHCE